MDKFRRKCTDCTAQANLALYPALGNLIYVFITQFPTKSFLAIVIQKIVSRTAYGALVPLVHNQIPVIVIIYSQCDKRKIPLDDGGVPMSRISLETQAMIL